MAAGQAALGRFHPHFMNFLPGIMSSLLHRHAGVVDGFESMPAPRVLR